MRFINDQKWPWQPCIPRWRASRSLCYRDATKRSANETPRMAAESTAENGFAETLQSRLWWNNNIRLDFHAGGAEGRRPTRSIYTRITLYYYIHLCIQSNARISPSGGDTWSLRDKRGVWRGGGRGREIGRATREFFVSPKWRSRRRGDNNRRATAVEFSAAHNSRLTYIRFILN